MDSETVKVTSQPEGREVVIGLNQKPVDAADGTPLLFYEDIAALWKVEVKTVRWYNAAAGRARQSGTPVPADFPEASYFVRRVTVNVKGQRIPRRTPVWREDVIPASHPGPGRRPNQNQPAGS